MQHFKVEPVLIDAAFHGILDLCDLKHSARFISLGLYIRHGMYTKDRGDRVLSSFKLMQKNYKFWKGTNDVGLRKF